MESNDAARLRGYILWRLRLLERVPARAARIHTMLLHTGKWPTLTLGRVQRQLDKLVELGVVERLPGGRSPYYRLSKEEHNAKSADA